MERTIKKLSENILDKFSMDFLRNQVLKNAYGNDDTVIAKLDPRVLIGWYLFFGLVPWFSSNVVFLAGCFMLVVVTTVLAKVVGLVLFLFMLGVFSQTGYMFITSLFFGGNAETILPLLIFTLIKKIFINVVFYLEKILILSRNYMNINRDYVVMNEMK